MFAMSIMLAAKGLGLETHPMDGFDEQMVKEDFDIPDRVVIPMLIAIGNLREGVKLLPRAMRFSYNDILSKDSFNKEWK
jgi:putative NAD(P)H nitroreductase